MQRDRTSGTSIEQEERSGGFGRCRRVAWLAAAASFAVCLAGCGGAGADDTEDAESDDGEEWVGDGVDGPEGDAADEDAAPEDGDETVCLCVDDTDCDDGEVCNGAEQCVDCACFAGVPADDGTACDDGDICTEGETCTAGACGGGVGVCECDTDDECLAYDDGDLCNGTPLCTGGRCVFEPATVVTCDSSGNTDCAMNRCVPATGICEMQAVPNGIACDDGNDCTEGDACLDGVCVAGAMVCPCETDADCAPHEDGDLCNGTLHCVDHACVVDPATVVTCDPSGDTDCLVNSCDPATGDCAPAPRADGTTCGDGDACTVGDACLDGACAPGAPRVCDDDNVCTDDSCVPATGCAYAPNTAPCDDGVFCTAVDTCSAGACVGAGEQCPVAECVAGCDEAAGGCAPQPAGTVCAPGAGSCAADGVCDGIALTCPGSGVRAAGTECRASVGVCDAVETCDGVTPDCPPDGYEAAGTPCPDGLWCNGPNACDGTGTCLPGADPCTLSCETCSEGTDRCDVNVGSCRIGGVCYASGATNPANQCQSCQPLVSPTSWSNKPNGTVCNDGQFCTMTDTCTAGVCTGVGARCPAGGCIAGCDEAGDRCIPAAAGTECRASAGPCDVAETCTGASTTCPADGYQPAGTPCRPAVDRCDVAEVCTGGAASCPADAFTPSGTPCNDGDVCTDPDTCDGLGVCAGPQICWAPIGGAVNPSCNALAHALATEGGGVLTYYPYVAWVADELPQDGVYVHRYQTPAWTQVGARLTGGAVPVQPIVDIQHELGSPRMHTMYVEQTLQLVHTKWLAGAVWVETTAPGYTPPCIMLFAGALAAPAAGADHTATIGAGGCGLGVGYGDYLGAGWWQCPSPPCVLPGLLTMFGGGNVDVAWNGVRALVALNDNGFRYVRYWQPLPAPGAWVDLGATLNIGPASGAGPGTQYLSIAIDSPGPGGGTPYVAWSEPSGVVNGIFVKRYDPIGGWTLLGAGKVSGAGSADYPSIAIIGGDPYVAYVEDAGGVAQIHVRTWDGTAWSDVGTILNNDAAASAAMPYLTGIAGLPYVAFREPAPTPASPSCIYVKRFE